MPCTPKFYLDLQVPLCTSAAVPRASESSLPFHVRYGIPDREFSSLLTDSLYQGLERPILSTPDAERCITWISQCSGISYRRFVVRLIMYVFTVRRTLSKYEKIKLPKYET